MGSLNLSFFLSLFIQAQGQTLFLFISQENQSARILWFEININHGHVFKIRLHIMFTSELWVQIISFFHPTKPEKKYSINQRSPQIGL